MFKNTALISHRAGTWPTGDPELKCRAVGKLPELFCWGSLYSPKSCGQTPIPSTRERDLTYYYSEIRYMRMSPR